jgi:hypothetical protein
MWNVTSKVTRCLSHRNGKDTTLYVHRPDKSNWSYSMPVATSGHHVPGIIVVFFMCLFVIFVDSSKLNLVVTRNRSCNDFCSHIIFINCLPSHHKMVARQTFMRLSNFSHLNICNWHVMAQIFHFWKLNYILIGSLTNVMMIYSALGTFLFARRFSDIENI